MAEKVEDALRDHGIAKHPDKDKDDVTDGDCVGVELVGRRWWWPPALRMWSLLRAVRALLVVRRASPAGMRAFLGTLQWYDLLERAKLAVYDEVYAFAASEPEKVRRCVPAACLCELLCGVVLKPFWGFDMRRPHQPLVIASDVSVAELDVDHVRRLARLDAKADDHAMLSGGGAPPDKDRIGEPHDLGLRVTDFATVLSARAPEEHINIMEGKAFLAALRWVLRRPDRHRRRVVVLIDSRVWIGAAAKGRSSSVPLLRLLRRVSALVLASGVVAHYVYIPSEHNPADAPSRGVIPRSSRRAAHGARRMSCLEEELWCRRQAAEGDRYGVRIAHEARLLGAARLLVASLPAIVRQLRRLDKNSSGRVASRSARRLLERFVPAPTAAADLLALFGLSDALGDGCLQSGFVSWDRWVVRPRGATDRSLATDRMCRLWFVCRCVCVCVCVRACVCPRVFVFAFVVLKCCWHLLASFSIFRT